MTTGGRNSSIIHCDGCIMQSAALGNHLKQLPYDGRCFRVYDKMMFIHRIP